MIYVEISLAPNPKPVWKGELPINTDDASQSLDAVFAKFNLDHPPSYPHRSLSVGDEVFLATPQSVGTYRCESFGWSPIQ
ncbi:MAG: hypothetical protein JST84_05105 [Acidobacteria bacterium]|nr:hypothetical protein [Acidobacteriota bacterium]